MLEVEKILQEHNIKYRLIELRGLAVTHEDVKKYSDADPEDDCKTIIVKDNKDIMYAFFLRGMQRLDFSKVKDAVGRKVSIVSKEDLQEKTGKSSGAISPLLLEMEIFVDKRVLERENIQFSSGDPKYGLEMLSKYLEKLISFQIVDVAKI